MCDCYTPQGVPIPTNKRNNAAKIFDNPKVAAEVTWYEYFYPDFKLAFLFLQCCFSHVHVSNINSLVKIATTPYSVSDENI
jgi:hypothetical protein